MTTTSHIDWFVVQNKPNAFRLAQKNLERQGFRTFLPMIDSTKRNGSRFIQSVKPLFPGYFFVGFDPETAPWRKVNNTVGVARLVTFANKPSPVAQDLIEGIMARSDDNGKLMPPPTLKAGDEVEITSGPFAEFVATIEKIDAEKRVWLLLDFLGQKTRTQVMSDQLALTA